MMSKLIKFRLFGHIFVLAILFGFTRYDSVSWSAVGGFFGVCLFLYSLVLIANLVTVITNYYFLRPFSFSWTHIQSEHWMVFVVSLVIACMRTEGSSFLSFFIIFIFFYSVSFLAIKIIPKR